MLTATVLAIFYIPLFFVLVRRNTRSLLSHLHHSEAPPAPERLS
jgi:multidrug efflux pump